MLHVCVQKFNVTDTVGKFLRTNQGLSNTCLQLRVRQPLYTMEWAVTGLSRLLRNCLSAQIEIGPLLRFVICKQAAVVHIRNRIRNSEFLMMKQATINGAREKQKKIIKKSDPDSGNS